MINEALQNSFFEMISSEMELSANHKDFDLNKSNRETLSERGKFLIDVHGLLSRLTDQLRDIENIKIFISVYPRPQYYQTKGIDQYDYIKYHINVLIHQILTILDIMLLTINEVYALNIPEEKCIYYNVKEAINDVEILDFIN